MIGDWKEEEVEDKEWGERGLEGRGDKGGGRG